MRTTLRLHDVAFGSYTAGTAKPGSDVDIAIWSELPVDDWELRGALPDIVDLLDLTTAPEGLAGRAALSDELVLDDDPPTRIRWQADVRKRYLDEACRRERFRRDFARAHG